MHSESVILSNFQLIELNVWFTTEPLKALSDQEWMNELDM